MSLVATVKQTNLAQYAKRVLRRLRRPAPAPLLRMRRKLHPSEPMPPATVPAPYRLATCAPGEEQRWIDLLNDSAEFGRWDRDRLGREITGTLLPDGTVFIKDGERLVGCASVCDMAEHRPWAILMYVALLPECRGRGMGQALVWETLRVCQRRGYPGMLLHTENHRLAAVRSYFRLGFTPVLAEGAAGARQWADMLGRAFLRDGR